MKNKYFTIESQLNTKEDNTTSNGDKTHVRHIEKK